MNMKTRLLISFLFLSQNLIAQETLQSVTDRGNTTTNPINIDAFLNMGTYERLWRPSLGLGGNTQAYHGLYGPQLTYNAKISSGIWKAIAGGYASSLWHGEGNLEFAAAPVSTDSPISWLSKFRINSADNKGYILTDFGVGTTNPAAKLHVATTSATSNTIAAFSNGLTEGLEIVHSGSNGGVYGLNNAVVLSATYFESGGSFRPMILGTSNSARITIRENGDIGIGTLAPDAKLTVAGKIHSQEVKVTTSAGADFVFEDDYKLLSLSETEAFIKENGHLPEIAPAETMKREGIELGEMNIKLLQKIEELTLHLIKQEKEMKNLIKSNQNLEVRLLMLER